MRTAPNHVLRTVVKHGKRVGRPKNADVRTREHLTPSEVEQLAQAARKRGRYGHRDALAIRLASRHGFRVSELCELRWDQIDLRAGLVHVTRKKNDVASAHPGSRRWSSGPARKQVSIFRCTCTAAARLRVPLRQSRGGHAGAAALARAPVDPAHSARYSELSAERFKDW